MQNQVNMNQVSVNVEGGAGGGAGGGGTSQPQFIIQGIPALQGGVVNLAELLNKASTGTHTRTYTRTHTHTETHTLTHPLPPPAFQETLRRPWLQAPWTRTCSTLLLWSRTEVKGSSPS